MPARLVVLVSGSGTLLQALLDAQAAGTLGAEVVAVGADRVGTLGQQRAERAGVPTFVESVTAHPDRAAWDAALSAAVESYAADLVVTAGFMKILGPVFLAAHAARTLNSHPSLLPAFAGGHAVADALAFGAKVAGCTVHLVEAAVDSGPVLAQAAVPVLDGDDEATLHERIKVAERMLLVDTVTRIVRDGYTVTGRKVTFG